MQPGKGKVQAPTKQPVLNESEKKRSSVTRRNFIRTGAILGAGIVGASYIKPSFQTIQIPHAFASASAPPPTNGCTPGFWKNHTNEWAAAGFQTTDSFNGTFVVNAFNPDRTLLEAVQSGGGGINALGRHAVAALLNAAALGASSFGLSVDQVKQMVQDAFASGGSIEGAKTPLSF